MNLDRKLEHAKAALLSITRHDDEPVAARKALADEVKAFLDAEVAAAGEREAAKDKAAADAKAAEAAAQKPKE